MLALKSVHPTLPAVDINRAREFYEKKLGLEVAMEDPSPGIFFKVGESTMLYVYQRGQTKADHTVAEFDVDDIEDQVKKLKSRGIEFEEVDVPGLKTVDGIATMSLPSGEVKAAFPDWWQEVVAK